MDYGIFLDSCYFNISAEECNDYPAGMDITNIHFENFTGYTSGVYGNAVARLSCSSSEDAVCANITVKDFNVETPCGGKPVIICDGIDYDVGVDCVPFESEEAQTALKANCTTPMAKIDIDSWGSGIIERKKGAYHRAI